VEDRDELGDTHLSHSANEHTGIASPNPCPHVSAERLTALVDITRQEPARQLRP
jgi:hypothetical protein